MKIFGVLQKYKFAIDDVSYYYPVEKQGFFNKKVKYGIFIVLKSNPNKPLKIFYDNKKERDRYSIAMDNTFLSLDKPKGE